MNMSEDIDFLIEAITRQYDDLPELGLPDPRVLETIRKVPRERFVSAADVDLAYQDRALPLAGGQTISQPFVVASMTQALALTKTCRVLEIGTGSGYQTAILAELAGEVWSLERLPELSDRARGILARLGYGNIHLRIGDGFAGWPESAPFDAVIVTAAPEHLPETLLAQLKPGGRMVVPVGPRNGEQMLMLVTKSEEPPERRPLYPVRFVPMLPGEG
jgi:protein-L-isoaspartate(D-aspartate) O-methyltransferase